MTTASAFDLAFNNDRTADLDVEPLPAAEEFELITAAKKGSNSAMAQLIVQYRPALRRRMSDALRAENADRDEVGADLLMAMAVAVDAAEPGERLSLRLASAIYHVSDHYQLGASKMTLPKRSLRKVQSALWQAGEDVDKARHIACHAAADPRDRMSVDTFDAIVHAIRHTTGNTEDPDLAAELSAAHDPISAVEERLDDVLDVAVAFDAVDDVTHAIIRHAYGFEDYDYVVDAEVGHRLGLTRSKTQRLRKKGLETMHDALCTDEDAHERCAFTRGYGHGEEVAA